MAQDFDPASLLKMQRLYNNSAYNWQTISESERRVIDATIAEARAIKREIDKNRQAFHPPCPEDGTPGTWCGTTGSYQVVVFVYACENGHHFSWRANKGRLVTGYWKPLVDDLRA